MKTVLTAVLAVLGTFVLLPHSAGQAPGSGQASGASPFLVMPGAVNAVPRFEIVTLHPSGIREDSALLDTRTGCVWIFAVLKNGDQDWDFRPLDADASDKYGAAQVAACDEARAAALAPLRSAAPSR